MNSKPLRALGAIGAVALLGGAQASLAQSRAEATEKLTNSPLVSKLESCTTITDDAERLACFDREVGALVGAASEGAVKVVDKEEITEARRKLFGYSVPDAGIFKADSKEEEEASRRLTSTITTVRQVAPKEWYIWIEEGNAQWRLRNDSIRFRPPEVGDAVEFEPATMGTYWIKVNGRKGVRGNRIG